MIALHRSSIARQVGVVVAHLRLPVQLTLAPLYLWGVFGAGGRWSAATVGAFVAIHLFLYGGTTVFNSYYDRDEGLIAGMEHPVALPAWALPFSVAWQLVGLLLAATVNVPLALFYAAYAGVGALYSHPRPRLKARPFVSTALIVVFQGLGGFVAGWLASEPGHVPAGGRFWLMALVAAGTTVGLYPLTQVYQIAEDTARGDRTLAVALGPRGAFTFALAAFVVAATAGLLVMIELGRPLDAAALVAGYVALGAAVAAIGAQFARRPIVTTYRRLMRVQFAASAALALFVAAQFARLF